jgi:hypothetical protein
MKKSRLMIPLMVLWMAALACNFPGQATPTPGVLPLELTVTALFRTAAALPPTRTPPPLVSTATQPPPTQPAPTQPPAAATQSPPTATQPPPAPTATRVPVRPGARVEASFMNTPPVIDGDWSEWKKVATEYPATHVVFGKANWKNEDDLAGSYYVGWDLSNLYLAAKVRDDQYVQIAQGQDLYKGDSLELLLDLDLPGDFYSAQLNGDDYQIGISPGRPTIGDKNPEAYLWYPSGKAGKLNNVVIAARYEGAIYRVEAAIPWSVFGVIPYKGMRMGFAFSVSDNDQPGNAIQESMVSSAAGRTLTDPTSWGEVTLK